ncbi:MAG: hypothetical protein DI538_03260 [Azospira oryzae]|nr:MAG: hypothetical protein DI538_03260 [Azospira oryzae]
MNRNQLTYWLVLVPLFTFAQHQWGYGIARLSSYSQDGQVQERILISDPIALSQRECAITASADEEDDQVERYAGYEACMKTWFANQLQKSNKVKEEEIQEVLGQVGLWPVHSLHIVLRSNPSIDYTHFLNDYSFTSKASAQQHRREFIASIQRLHVEPVLIHHE